MHGCLYVCMSRLHRHESNHNSPEQISTKCAEIFDIKLHAFHLIVFKRMRISTVSKLMECFRSFVAFGGRCAYVTYLLTIRNDKSSHSTFIFLSILGFHSRSRISTLCLTVAHSLARSLAPFHFVRIKEFECVFILFYFILQFSSLFKLTKTFSGRQSVKENIFNSRTIIL